MKAFLMWTQIFELHYIHYEHAFRSAGVHLFQVKHDQMHYKAYISHGILNTFEYIRDCSCLLLFHILYFVF